MSNQMIVGSGKAQTLNSDKISKDVSIVDQMLYDPEFADRVYLIAKTFASSPTAPAHCYNNPAIVIQAMDIARTTDLNILFILNCMFQPAKGARVGVMAELVLASLRSTKAIKDDPVWEFVGDWTKVKGKHVQADSRNSDKKYTKAAYTTKDEEGLGVNLTLHWSDRDDPTTYGPYWLIDQQPRFSTLWATDPAMQMQNKILRTVVRYNRPNLLNQVCVGEEAMLDQQYVGPENAKVVGSGKSSGDPVKDRLSDVANRSKTKRQQTKIPDPMPIAPPSEPAMPMDQNNKPQEMEGELVRNEPDHKDPIVSQQEESQLDEYIAMEFEDGPDNGSNSDMPTVIWLNPQQKAFKIPAGKQWTDVFVLALMRATSIDSTLKLQEQNKQHIQRLPEADRARIQKAMEDRASSLDDGGRA